MKKISLKDINLNGIEQLSRDELKKILGGFDGGYGGYGDGGYGDYGGYGGAHGELCETHADCPPGHVCVITQHDYICCDSNDLHGTGPHPHPACRNID